MLDPNTVAIGKKYRNIKHGDVYEVVLLSQNSEKPTEFLISYQKDGDELPWTRPSDLFAVKFEEADDVPA